MIRPMLVILGHFGHFLGLRAQNGPKMISIKLVFLNFYFSEVRKK